MEADERSNGIAWVAAVTAAWIPAWWHLSVEWRLNDQYQIGWGVPFLFVWVVLHRWGGPVKSDARCTWIWAGVCFAWAVAALGELLLWRDPVWRMTGGALAAGALILTALLFFRAGGASLLGRQWFALAFAMLAIPWPVPLEQWITQHLLKAVTMFSTVFINGAGIPALQEGNVIELRNGLVGVTEACSGISSLHASLVASIFLGEFFGLIRVRRFALVAAGIGICLAGNCFRVIALSMIMNATDGTTSQAWHDPVGLIATIFSFAFTGFLGMLLRPRGGGVSMPKDSRFQWPCLRGCDGFGVFCCFAALPLAAWITFRSPSGPEMRSRWTLDAGQLPADWMASPVEPQKGMEGSLHFSEWQAYHVTSPEGWTAQVIHLYWRRGSGIPGTAFFHTPATCLSSVGWIPTANTETWTLLHKGQSLTVAAYHLRDPGGSSIVAIQSLLIGGSSDQFCADLSQPTSTAMRLALLWRAPSRTVDEEILAYMPDLGSPDLQARSFSELLDLMLKRQ